MYKNLKTSFPLWITIVFCLMTNNTIVSQILCDPIIACNVSPSLDGVPQKTCKGSTFDVSLSHSDSKNTYLASSDFNTYITHLSLANSNLFDIKGISSWTHIQLNTALSAGSVSASNYKSIIANNYPKEVEISNGHKQIRLVYSHLTPNNNLTASCMVCINLNSGFPSQVWLMSARVKTMSVGNQQLTAAWQRASIVCDKDCEYSSTKFFNVNTGPIDFNINIVENARASCTGNGSYSLSFTPTGAGGSASSSSIEFTKHRWTLTGPGVPANTQIEANGLTNFNTMYYQPGVYQIQSSFDAVCGNWASAKLVNIPSVFEGNPLQVQVNNSSTYATTTNNFTYIPTCDQAYKINTGTGISVNGTSLSVPAYPNGVYVWTLPKGWKIHNNGTAL